jgi:hypothetical protein
MRMQNLHETKKRAAAYIRVSTEDQTEYSPDAQRRALLKYAEDNGYEITESVLHRRGIREETPKSGRFYAHDSTRNPPAALTTPFLFQNRPLRQIARGQRCIQVASQTGVLGTGHFDNRKHRR